MTIPLLLAMSLLANPFMPFVGVHIPERFSSTITNPGTTLAEARFILLEYGTWVKPKKPSKKERVSQALTGLLNARE